MKQRNVIVTLATIIFLAISSISQSSAPVVTVFKTATCSCCNKWIEHLKANGLSVKVKEVESTAAYEKQYKVPQAMQSCHTAVIDGYTIEGHVPAREIKRLLSERPNVTGLAVPGMPLGSPGMEAPRSDAYSVLSFDGDGHTAIYAQYPAR